MPNWKKIALSGSSPEFDSLRVDNTIAVQEVNANTLTGSLSYSNLINTPNLVSQSGTFEPSNILVATGYNTVTSSNSPSLSSITVTGAATASIFSGSFVGDGSQLTNISTDVGEIATVADTFTDVVTKSVTHGFGTKNVIVSVYNNDDQVIIPTSITTATSESVDIVFDTTSSGRVVVAKGGHIVTGQTYRLEVSGSTQYSLTHSLDVDYPIVQAYSSSRKQIIPGDVESIDTNVINVSFDNIFNGTIIIKK